MFIFELVCLNNLINYSLHCKFSKLDSEYKHPRLKYFSRELIRVSLSKEGNEYEECRKKLVDTLESISYNNSENNKTPIEIITILARSIDFFQAIGSDLEKFIQYLFCLTRTKCMYINSVLECINSLCNQPFSVIVTLMNNGFLNLAFSLFSFSYPPNVLSDTLSSLSRVAETCIEYRNSIIDLFSLPMINRLMTVYLSDSRHEQCVQLICSYCLYPLSEQQTHEAFGLIHKALVTPNPPSHEKAIVSLFRALYSNPISADQFNFLPIVMHYFSDYTEHICYILGLLTAVPKMPPIIDIHIIALQISPNNNPKVVQAASWTLSQFAHNQPQFYQQTNIPKLITSLCDCYTPATYSVKEEIAYAIASLSTLLNEIEIVELSRNNILEVFCTLLTSTNTDTLSMVIDLFLRMVITIEFKDAVSELYIKLDQFGAISSLQDLCHEPADSAFNLRGKILNLNQKLSC